MAEVRITVSCSISGCDAEFDYDNEMTLHQFICDLQKEGMAWMVGSEPWEDSRYMRPNIFINEHYFHYTENQFLTLSELGLCPGSIVNIDDGIGCIMGLGAPETAVAARPPSHPEHDEVLMGADGETWDLVKDSNNIADIEYYLENYPTGKYSVPAKLKLRQLSS